jgi:hypothetical protein
VSTQIRHKAIEPTYVNIFGAFIGAINSSDCRLLWSNDLKLSLCLIKHVTTKTWGSGGIAPPFLTSALDGGEWPVSNPDRFTPRKMAPGPHWIGGWVGLRDSLDAVKKRKSCPCRESNPGRPALQYTDCADRLKHDEMERARKEVVVANFKALSRYSPGGLIKPTKDGQDIR